MNRKEKEQFLKENYEIIKEMDSFVYSSYLTRDEKTPVKIRLYKPNTMQELPKEAIEYAFKRHYGDHYYDVPRFWMGNNLDNGAFDCIYASRFRGRKGEGYTLYVYCNAILRRPFTEEQRKHYESLFYPFPTRCLRIYDSANDK